MGQNSKGSAPDIAHTLAAARFRSRQTFFRLSGSEKKRGRFYLPAELCSDEQGGKKREFKKNNRGGKRGRKS